MWVICVLGSYVSVYHIKMTLGNMLRQVNKIVFISLGDDVNDSKSSNNGRPIDVIYHRRFSINANG